MRHLFLLALAALLLAGCSTYDSFYQFRPRPAVATVRVKQTDDVAARVLVSLVGVLNAADDHGEEIEARIRIENVDAGEIALSPDALRIVTAGLHEMRVRASVPAYGVVAPRGEAAELTAYFPFPGGKDADDLDLGGLDLRWTLVVDGKAVVGSASFRREYERIYAYPVYPWYAGYAGYGWGGWYGGYGWGGYGLRGYRW